MSTDITEERIAEIRERLEKESLTHDTLEPKDYFAKMCGRLLNALLSARSQLATLQPVPQGVEVPELDPGANPHQRNIENPGSFGWSLNRAYRDGYNEARKNARLVPTPPQAAPGAVIEAGEFRREDRYVVLKRTDLERHATPAQLRELERTCEMVRAGRMTEGKLLNSYVVVADNWPEYEETWAKIQARVTGIPQPIQPEGRRVGPDEVVVPRSAAEYAILAFDWIECPDSEHYEASRAFHDALRTSAQDHNGEGAR